MLGRGPQPTPFRILLSEPLLPCTSPGEGFHLGDLFRSRSFSRILGGWSFPRALLLFCVCGIRERGGSLHWAPALGSLPPGGLLGQDIPLPLSLEPSKTGASPGHFPSHFQSEQGWDQDTCLPLQTSPLLNLTTFHSPKRSLKPWKENLKEEKVRFRN